jgi:hypothetical protein
VDGKTFDDLIRRFCTTRLTRVSALRGLVAGVAASLTGASLASDIDAKNKKKGHKHSAKASSKHKGSNKHKKKKGKQKPAPTITTTSTCPCPSEFSPKGCPNPGSNPQYTCKATLSGAGCGIDSANPPQGSVQVTCTGSTPSCVCQSTKCVVNGTTFTKGQAVGICKPVKCSDTFKPKTCQDLGKACGDFPDGCGGTLHCGDCDDHDKCTADSCNRDAGVCVHTPVDCDDHNACTIDSCDPATGCVHKDVDCDDGNACTADSCDPATGCVHKDIDCDDGIACTVDSCDPATGCVHKPDDSACDDGIACTADSCDPKSGCVNEPKDSRCDDGVACTVDTCDPTNANADANGCVYTPDDSLCDDNIACTVDTCDAKEGCQHKPDDSKCDDGVACTVDTCDPAKGCVNKPDDSLCDDGNACTIDSCDPATGCVHKDVNCDDGILCTADSCDPATGCVHTPTNGLCPPRAGCTVVCDPAHGDANGCVYTCACTADESPKGCPNPGDQPQYTCKRCPGGNNGGSVQVVCSGSTPHCVCNSTTCTIGSTTVPRGTDVTGICPPVNCSTGL